MRKFLTDRWKTNDSSVRRSRSSSRRRPGIPKFPPQKSWETEWRRHLKKNSGLDPFPDPASNIWTSNRFDLTTQKFLKLCTLCESKNVTAWCAQLSYLLYYKIFSGSDDSGSIFFHQLRMQVPYYWVDYTLVLPASAAIVLLVPRTNMVCICDTLLY